MDPRIAISVPCELRYRDAVAALIRHVCEEFERGGAHEKLAVQVVSAFNEAFNNLALHARGTPNPADIVLTYDAKRLVLEIADEGQAFEMDQVEEPDLLELPESGLGLFIIRSFMDDVEYFPGVDGDKNLLRLVHYLESTTEDGNLGVAKDTE